MLVKTVRTSQKGQLTLPVAMLRALGIKGKAELVAVQDGDKIVLARAERLAEPLIDELRGFEALGLSVFKQLWDNPEDEAWDNA